MEIAAHTTPIARTLNIITPYREEAIKTFKALSISVMIRTETPTKSPRSSCAPNKMKVTEKSFLNSCLNIFKNI